MTYATTLTDIKRIAKVENAQDVSASCYGLGALIAVDYNGAYYYASSRSSAVFVLC